MGHLAVERSAERSISDPGLVSQGVIPPRQLRRLDRIPRAFIAIALLFIFMTGVRIATKKPWVDEAWFTAPAIDLATHGTFGTRVLEPTGSHLTLYTPGAVLTGIHQHTYWIMPLYPVSLAMWGKAFGFSVFAIRVPSILWGLLLLASIWVLVRRLGGSEGAAALATAILAVEFGFVDAGSDGRMDMMSAALGFAGLAVYLTLRERHLARAALIGHALCTAALFTHPNGIWAGASLVVCTLWLDRRSVSLKLSAISALPYVVGATCWGLYILQAPAEFAAQFGANSAHRSGDLLHPLRAVSREFAQRYLTGHFFPGNGSAAWLKIIGLLMFVGAMAAMAALPGFRRRSGYQLLLCLAVLRFCMMSATASWKLPYYLVHALPFYAAIAGIVLYSCWTHPDRRRRFLAGAVLGAYFLVQLAVFAHLATAVSAYRRKYIPAVNYVRSIMRPGDLVAGSADLAFAMGFYNPQLTDDIWLGHWSGKHPTIVVVDDWYYFECLIMAKPTAQAYTKWATHELQTQFRLEKALDGYSIYRRIH